MWLTVRTPPDIAQDPLHHHCSCLEKCKHFDGGMYTGTTVQISKNSSQLSFFLKEIKFFGTTMMSSRRFVSFIFVIMLRGKKMHREPAK
jgi:hypothetical protein